MWASLPVCVVTVMHKKVVNERNVVVACYLKGVVRSQPPATATRYAASAPDFVHQPRAATAAAAPAPHVFNQAASSATNYENSGQGYVIAEAIGRATCRERVGQ